VHAHRAGATLRKRRRGKRLRHPWLAAVDGRATLGIAFKTRAEAILYAERVIALVATGGERRPPCLRGNLGTVTTTIPPFFRFVPLGKWHELRGRKVCPSATRVGCRRD
jgi:hypothetical protein